MSISEKSGMKLKELQLTLTSADAWGLLRKDLITALGVQRAKRFLLRYGYHCGVHEARILKDTINWQDDLEWLIAGSKMHHLTGRAFSYPDTFKVDIKKGGFDVSGYWIDSHEATQHLQYFPKHTEPVCFYLAGYASGYTSECLGKKTIFKEVKCKGKGDDHCSYVGKTVEEWGEEIFEDLFFFENEDMSGELDQMYRRVEQQKERFELGYSLSRNLTHAMLQGGGFQEFSNLLGESLHCQVLIENQHFELLAKYGNNPGMDEYMTVRNIWDKRKEQLLLNTIVETPLKDKTFTLLTTPIINRNQVYGFITIDTDQKSDDFRKDLLERVATVAALHVQNERVAIETEQRTKGELLEQLLNNKEVNTREIHSRFSYLGYDLTEPHYIIHIEINDRKLKEKGSVNYDYFKIRNQLTNIFYQNQHKFDAPLILTKLNTVQAIILKKYIDAKRTTIKEFGEQLLKQIGNQEQQIYIGISNETRHLSDFHKKAEEAKKAVELAKVRSSYSRVILTSELGHLSLFLNAREPEELERFADEKLHSILEYDQKKNSELLLTLFYYSQNEFNLHKTAREMSISISGMRYRISKVEDLLSIDLSSSNNRFEIQLSLQILLMVGKIKP
jgi:sugar diacid utilization regulator